MAALLAFCFARFGWAAVAVPSACDRGFVLKFDRKDPPDESTFDMTGNDDAAAKRFAGEIFDFLVAEDVEVDPDDATKEILVEQRETRLRAIEDLWPVKLFEACRGAVVGSELPGFNAAKCKSSIRRALVELNANSEKAPEASARKKRYKVTAPRGRVPAKISRSLPRITK